MRVKLDEGAFAPEKAHKEDAGFDLRTPKSFYVNKRGKAAIDTGIHVEIPYGYAGMIKSKSGINVKRHCLTEGVIDAGYSGSIVVKMYNHGVRTEYFEAGDKIAQLVLVKISEDSDVEIVDEIEGGARGNNGFGSTGR